MVDSGAGQGDPTTPPPLAQDDESSLPENHSESVSPALYPILFFLLARTWEEKENRQRYVRERNERRVECMQGEGQPLSFAAGRDLLHGAAAAAKATALFPRSL